MNLEMKRILLFFMIAVTCVTAGFSQDKGRKKSPEEMRREINEFKMKFIAQEIDLREDQQKRFFELFGQMTDERSAIFEQMIRTERKIKKDPNATDEDYANLTRLITDSREKDAEIEKAYDEKFATFLSAKQIYKMKSAEEKFRKKMREMRHKKREKRKKN